MIILDIFGGTANQSSLQPEVYFLEILWAPQESCLKHGELWSLNVLGFGFFVIILDEKRLEIGCREVLNLQSRDFGHFLSLARFSKMFATTLSFFSWANMKQNKKLKNWATRSVLVSGELK
jgi:hypothetical protein